MPSETYTNGRAVGDPAGDVGFERGRRPYAPAEEPVRVRQTHTTGVAKHGRAVVEDLGVEGTEHVADRCPLGFEAVDDRRRLGSELSADLDAAAAQLVQLDCGRVHPAGPRHREAVDLAGHRELRGVARHECCCRHRGGVEAEAGGDAEVVDEDGVGRLALDDPDGLLGDLSWLPQQIVASPVGLVAQRRDHPAGGRGEERSQVVSELDHRSQPGVAPGAHAQFGPSVTIAHDARPQTWPAGDDDIDARPGGPGGDRTERQVVRQVVGGDDEQFHETLTPTVS